MNLWHILIELFLILLPCIAVLLMLVAFKKYKKIILGILICIVSGDLAWFLYQNYFITDLPFDNLSLPTEIRMMPWLLLPAFVALSIAVITRKSTK